MGDSLRLEAHAVVLDLDGLLIDSESEAFRVACGILADQGVVLTREHFASHVGLSPRELYSTFVRDFALDIAVDDLLARRDELLESFYSGPTPMPGAIDFVRRTTTRGIAIAVASSSRHSLVTTAVDALGLGDTIEAVVGWGHVAVAAPKPAPDLYLAALRELGVPPAAALGVEDSCAGARASVAAGLVTVVVPSVWTRDQEFPVGVLPARSLAALDVFRPPTR